MNRTKKILIAVLIVLIVAAIFILPRYTKYHLPITIKPTKQESNQATLLDKKIYKLFVSKLQQHWYFPNLILAQINNILRKINLLLYIFRIIYVCFIYEEVQLFAL